MSLLEILEMNHEHDANVEYLAHLSDLPNHIDEKTMLPMYYNSRTDHDQDYLHQVMTHILGTYSIIHKPFKLKVAKSNHASNASNASRQLKIKDKFVKNMLDAYPFNLFNFKSRDECKSSNRTKAYYIKKTDMLNIINSTPELKKIFPANFKKLPKDDLCDVVFDNGNVV